MEAFFLYMYPLVTVVSMVAFFPQILQLIRSKEAPVGISPVSWCMWTASAVLTFGYGIFHLHDLMFCITAGINMTLNIFMTALLFIRLYAPSSVKKIGDLSTYP